MNDNIKDNIKKYLCIRYPSEEAGIEFLLNIGLDGGMYNTLSLYRCSDFTNVRAMEKVLAEMQEMGYPVFREYKLTFSNGDWMYVGDLNLTDALAETVTDIAVCYKFGG